MFEVMFLILLGVVWILFAVIQDWRTHEVANWLSLSLIVFALGFRFFYSLFLGDGFSFFYQGVIGFGIFVSLGLLFYYGKVFAGGDAKLMMALGAVIPFYNLFLLNLKLIISFVLLFLFVGAIYGLVFSLIYAIKNKRLFVKEFNRQFNKKKRLMYFMISLGILVVLFSFVDIVFLSLGIIIFISPYLYLWAISVDTSCMVKNVSPNKLTEGDWLYKDIYVGNKRIEATWDGLTKEQISLLQKKKKSVLVRYGIPFTPVFLIAFLIMILIRNFILSWTFF